MVKFDKLLNRRFSNFLTADEFYRGGRKSFGVMSIFRIYESADWRSALSKTLLSYKWTYICTYVRHSNQVRAFCFRDKIGASYFSSCMFCIKSTGGSKKIVKYCKAEKWRHKFGLNAGFLLAVIYTLPQLGEMGLYAQIYVFIYCTPWNMYNIKSNIDISVELL